MDDLLHCPICGNKLKNSHLNYNLSLPFVVEKYNYVERTCAIGHSHVLSFWTNKTTYQMDLLKISLSLDYSRFIEINFLDQTCQIIYVNDGLYENINVPHVIIPDFPDLLALKEKVSLYILLS